MNSPLSDASSSPPIGSATADYADALSVASLPQPVEVAAAAAAMVPQEASSSPPVAPVASPQSPPAQPVSASPVLAAAHPHPPIPVPPTPVGRSTSPVGPTPGLLPSAPVLPKPPALGPFPGNSFPTAPFAAGLDFNPFSLSFCSLPGFMLPMPTATAGVSKPQTDMASHPMAFPSVYPGYPLLDPRTFPMWGMPMLPFWLPTGPTGQLPPTLPTGAPLRPQSPSPPFPPIYPPCVAPKVNCPQAERATSLPTPAPGPASPPAFAPSSVTNLPFAPTFTLPPLVSFLPPAHPVPNQAASPTQDGPTSSPAPPHTSSSAGPLPVPSGTPPATQPNPPKRLRIKTAAVHQPKVSDYFSAKPSETGDKKPDLHRSCAGVDSAHSSSDLTGPSRELPVTPMTRRGRPRRQTSAAGEQGTCAISLLRPSAYGEERSCDTASSSSALTGNGRPRSPHTSPSPTTPQYHIRWDSGSSLAGVASEVVQLRPEYETKDPAVADRWHRLYPPGLPTGILIRMRRGTTTSIGRVLRAAGPPQQSEYDVEWEASHCISTVRLNADSKDCPRAEVSWSLVDRPPLRPGDRVAVLRGTQYYEGTIEEVPLQSVVQTKALISRIAPTSSQESSGVDSQERSAANNSRVVLQRPPGPESTITVALNLARGAITREPSAPAAVPPTRADCNATCRKAPARHVHTRHKRSRKQVQPQLDASDRSDSRSETSEQPPSSNGEPPAKRPRMPEMEESDGWAARAVRLPDEVLMEASRDPRTLVITQPRPGELEAVQDILEREFDLLPRMIAGIVRKGNFDTRTVVVSLKGVTVGAATLKLHKLKARAPVVLEIVLFAIKAEDHKRGFGTLLSAAICEMGHRIGSERVVLRAAPGAHGFWERVGYVDFTPEDREKEILLHNNVDFNSGCIFMQQACGAAAMAEVGPRHIRRVLASHQRTVSRIVDTMTGVVWEPL